MDLDLEDINLNELAIVTVNIEGILDEDDLRELAMGEPSSGSAPSAEALEEVDDPSNLLRIREKHHSVARLVAQGLRQTLVAKIAGFTDSYLSVLLNNPAMQELVEMYRIQHNGAAEVIGENLRRVGGKALEKLEEKIDKGQLDGHALISAAKLGFDRSGHGPSSSHKVESTTHVIDHAKIAEFSARARQGSKAYVIPVEEVRAPLLPAPEEKGE